jgi:Flp pilus assembly protein TadG
MTASTATGLRLQEQRGAALVEFAVVSIVFFTFVFAAAELSRLVFDYNIVSAATREGARFAAVRGATSRSPVTASDVKSYVASHSLGRLSAAEVTVTWLEWDAANSRCGAATGGNVPGNCVRVTSAQTSAPAVATLVPRLSSSLRSTASMVISR